LSASATPGVGDLRRTLEGLVQESRVAWVAGIGPPAVWPAAELFTSSGGAAWGSRFPRWWLTPGTVSVQKLRQSEIVWTARPRRGLRQSSAAFWKLHAAGAGALASVDVVNQTMANW